MCEETGMLVSVVCGDTCVKCVLCMTTQDCFEVSGFYQGEG